MTEAEKIEQLATELERFRQEIGFVQTYVLREYVSLSELSNDPAYLRAKQFAVEFLGLDSPIFSLTTLLLTFAEISKDEASDSI